MKFDKYQSQIMAYNKEGILWDQPKKPKTPEKLPSTTVQKALK